MTTEYPHMIPAHHDHYREAAARYPGRCLYHVEIGAHPHYTLPTLPAGWEWVSGRSYGYYLDGPDGPCTQCALAAAAA